MKDSRGTEIRRGQNVAYNLSGDVALGLVVDVLPKHVKIEWLAGGYARAGHISKCKAYGMTGQVRQVLVLERSDCVERL